MNVKRLKLSDNIRCEFLPCWPFGRIGVEIFELLKLRDLSKKFSFGIWKILGKEKNI